MDEWLKSGKKQSESRKRLRILGVILCFCVLFAICPDIPVTLSVSAAGTAGTDWSLEDGTLTIESDVGMEDWIKSGRPNNTSNVTKAVIKNGVTSIGACAFQNCGSLTNVEIPSGVTSIGDNAFSNCAKLTDIRIPSGVKGIGDYAFRDCRSLPSIEIPDGVTSIGTSAFYQCSSLTFIKLPSGVTSIRDFAFYGCRSLSGIELPSDVASIGNSAFNGCNSLANINIPSGVTSIGNSAFIGCSSLLSIEIPSGVTSIGNSVFKNCNKLTDIRILSSLESIGDSAFSNCSSLPGINMPSSVISIGNSAFSGCSSLSNINLPSDLESIGDSAFSNCSSLSGINIPSGVTGIGNAVFSGCSSLSGIELPSGVTSIGNSAFSNCSSLSGIEIPSGVTSIGAYAFYGCSSLSGIELPSGVASIGNSAFRNCSSLQSIELPSGVTSIRESVFYGCSSLTSIGLPLGITSIEGYAFGDCESLTNIKIPSGVTSIGAYAFQNCSSLQSIELPSGVKTIQLSMFKNCNKLSEVILPSGVTSIGNSAFYDCKNLTNIKLPSGVTSIGDSAFANCSSLPDIGLPSGVTSIGSSAFANCSGLSGIKLPSSMTNIGNSAFNGCSSLQSIEIPSGVATIGSAMFRNCEKLSEVTLPETVTNIGDSAFHNCKSLTNIKLPSGVTSIGNSAFQNCSSLLGIEIPSGVKTIGSFMVSNCEKLSEVTLPETVTSIGNSAFYNCKSLTNIKLPSGVTSIESSAFSSCEALAKVEMLNEVPPAMNGGAAFEKCGFVTAGKKGILVPVGKTEDYAGAGGWSRYAAHITDGTPKITVKPTNQTVQKGETAAFSVTAEGEGTLKYQWQVDRKDNSFVDIENATSSTYVVSDVAQNFDGYKYRCVIKNDRGEVTSGEVILTVTDSDADNVAAAKTAVQEALAGITATNKTTKESLQNVVDTALINAGISDVLVTVEELSKTDATIDAEGSISGSISIISKNDSSVKDSIAISKTIAQLTLSDKEKVEAAKPVVQKALGGITAANDTTKESLQNAIDTALANADISDVVVTVGDITKTEATSSAVGSISGSITIECGSESVSMKISKTIARLPLSDEEKVEKAKTAVQEALGRITVTNNTTRESLQNTINTALVNAGIRDVTVTVGELFKTEATVGAEGSISGSITIECGSELDSIEISKTIARLPVSDEEKVAAAKTIVQEALEEITATNETTKESIQNAIDTALVNAGISDVTVTVGELFKTEASVGAEGSISGSISIECGSESDSLEISKAIAGLPLSDEEKVEAAKTAVEEALAGITVTNDTTNEDLQNEIETALANGDMSDVVVTVGDIIKTEATSGAEGSISGNITIECGSESVSIPVIKTIARLPLSEEEKAEKVETAKTAVQQALEGITLTNDITKEGIQNAIDTALADAGISDVVVTVGDIIKTEATSSAEGSISMSIIIECGDESVSLPVSSTIARLPLSDEEKVAEVKTAVQEALAGITVTNNTTKESLQNAIDMALANADISGVTVTVGDITKTEATSGGKGSISGSIIIECGSKSDSIIINKVILTTGKIEKEVEKDEKAPDTILTTSEKELSEIILTGEEKAQVENGTDIKFILGVKDAGNTVSSGDKAAVQAVLKGSSGAREFVVGQYLDISLYKVIGVNRSAISETTEKLTIVINIPDGLKSKESGKLRTYAVIRVHGGAAEMLTDSDSNAHTITIATDRFSTYAIVYQEAGGGETVKPTPEPEENNGEEFDKEKGKIDINSGLKAIQKGKKLQISWGRVKGADGYNVYVQYDGKKFSAKSLNQVKSGKKTKLTIKKVNGRKLDTKKNFKLYVVAYRQKDGKRITLAKTLTVYVAGKDSAKYTNVKSIQIKKTSYTLKKGKTLTLQPKAVLQNKRKKQLSAAGTKQFRYMSSNKKVATVTAGGKIKAKGKGTCTIYVFAKNGCKRKIKIKVKK